MRDIKFRVWDIKNNQFYERDDFVIDPDGLFRIRRYSDLYDDMWLDPINSEDYLLQQYIGLKDKNGVEIYEGDLVKLFSDPEEVFEVIYDDYHDAKNPAFVLKSDHGYGDWFSNKDREVVGNIHEGNFKYNIQDQEPR